MSNDELLKEKIDHERQCALELRERLYCFKTLIVSLEYAMSKGWTIEEFHKNMVQVVKDSEKIVRNLNKRVDRANQKLAWKHWKDRYAKDE